MPLIKTPILIIYSLIITYIKLSTKSDITKIIIEDKVVIVSNNYKEILILTKNQVNMKGLAMMKILKELL